MKEELFENILSETDKSYKAKVGGKWLKGNGLTEKEKDADTFESKTEPMQRINQMKKDGKISKNANVSTKEIFESILKESARGPELQFIVSSYVDSDKREEWRVKEDKEFDKAVGIGQDVRFRLSELKDLIYDLPDKIVKYRDETEDVSHVIRHECFFKEVRTSMWDRFIIVKYDTTSIYDNGVRSGGYIEIYISLDYDSFEKYLTE